MKYRKDDSKTQVFSNAVFGKIAAYEENKQHGYCKIEVYLQHDTNYVFV